MSPRVETSGTPVAHPFPWRRAFVSLAAPAMVWLTSVVPLPGLVPDRLEASLGQTVNELNLSAFALGLTPFVSAFLIVELAAVCVPRLRRLRTGGPEGRRRLMVATTWLGLGFAAVQASGMAHYLKKLDVLEPHAFSRSVLTLTLIGATCTLVLLTTLLDRAALGGGYALLLTSFAAAPLLSVVGWAREEIGAADGLLPLTVFAGAVAFAAVSTVLVLLWRPGARALPLPACGVIPYPQGHALMTFATLLPAAATWLGFDGPPASGTPGGRGVILELALTVLLALGLGLLFNRPSRVAAFTGGVAPRIGPALFLSTAYVLGIAGLDLLLRFQLGFGALTLVPVVALTALGLDMFAEAAAFRAHGEMVAVWPEHRLYAVDALQGALQAHDIPSFARSRHQRALWHIFTPFIPVQILVPRGRAEEARRVLDERLAAADGLGVSGRLPPVVGRPARHAQLGTWMAVAVGLGVGVVGASWVLMRSSAGPAPIRDASHAGFVLTERLAVSKAAGLTLYVPEPWRTGPLPVRDEWMDSGMDFGLSMSPEVVDLALDHPEGVRLLLGVTMPGNRLELAARLAQAPEDHLLKDLENYLENSERSADTLSGLPARSLTFSPTMPSRGTRVRVWVVPRESYTVVLRCVAPVAAFVDREPLCRALLDGMEVGVPGDPPNADFVLEGRRALSPPTGLRFTVPEPWSIEEGESGTVGERVSLLHPDGVRLLAGVSLARPGKDAFEATALLAVGSDNPALKAAVESQLQEVERGRDVLAALPAHTVTFTKTSPSGETWRTKVWVVPVDPYWVVFRCTAPGPTFSASAGECRRVLAGLHNTLL